MRPRSRNALLALALLALTGAARPNDGARQRAVSVLRAAVISGTPQSAHAYASWSKKAYYADFPAPLVVRWIGPPPGEQQRKVEFTCEGCTFLPTDQPNKGANVERINGVENAYTAKVVHGVATLRVNVEAPNFGTYVVRAQPVARAHERAERSTFQLTLR